MRQIRTFFRTGMIFILSLVILFPSSVSAASNSPQITREYLSDGSYFETVISSTNARSSIKNASKTTTYKNADGDSLWYVKVTANFDFNGSTSKCTAASASAGSYTKVWKILDKRASRSGNSGSATALAGSYMGGLFVGSVTKTITLSCDKNGNLT